MMFLRIKSFNLTFHDSQYTEKRKRIPTVADSGKVPLKESVDISTGRLMGLSKLWQIKFQNWMTFAWMSSFRPMTLINKL